MSNYPDNISPSDPSAPWNKERSADDISDEIEQLTSLTDYIEKLALELTFLDSADELFSSVALSDYDHEKPADMLEAMLSIIRGRIAELRRL